MPPILALLKPALNNKELIAPACRVWLILCRILNKRSLAEYLSPMMVSLLSVFPSEDDLEASTDTIKMDVRNPADELLLMDVLKVIMYLLEDRFEDVKESLKHIPCVPRCRLLSDVERVSFCQRFWTIGPHFLLSMPFPDCISKRLRHRVSKQLAPTHATSPLRHCSRQADGSHANRTSPGCQLC